LVNEEAIKELELIRILIDKVSSDYNISTEKIIEELYPKDKVDVSIFANEKLSPTECLVKYLRENKFSKFSEIAEFLKRNQNTIQTTYKNAQKKQPEKLSFISSNVLVPLDIFQTNKYTILESLVKYLKSGNLTNNEIAKLTNKSNKTIWTVNNRVMLK
jgi:DNA-binding CsgD family transcriptional regulator